MTKSDEQYRQELSEIEYRVTRHAATEPPFTGRYWDHWDEGRYHCVCCGTHFLSHPLSLMQAVVGQAITRHLIPRSLASIVM